MNAAWRGGEGEGGEEGEAPVVASGSGQSVSMRTACVSGDKSPISIVKKITALLNAPPF